MCTFTNLGVGTSRSDKPQKVFAVNAHEVTLPRKSVIKDKLIAQEQFPSASRTCERCYLAPKFVSPLY